MSGSDWVYMGVVIGIMGAISFLNFAVKTEMERVASLQVALRECEVRCVVPAHTPLRTEGDTPTHDPAP